MKRIIMLLVVVSAFGAFAADSWKITLTGTSATVAPNQRARPTTLWDAGAVVAGDYVVNDSGQYYWCISGSGTPGVEPTHGAGVATAGSHVFLRLTGRRNEVTIQLTQSGVDVWFKEGTGPAVLGENRLLIGKGMAWVFDDMPGEINALAGSGTATITITEK